jgi:hypothetical protein
VIGCDEVGHRCRALPGPADRNEGKVPHLD